MVNGCLAKDEVIPLSFELNSYPTERKEYVSGIHIPLFIRVDLAGSKIIDIQLTVYTCTCKSYMYMYMYVLYFVLSAARSM